MVKGKTIEERFKKLTPREHILKRPGMYIGNVYTEPTKMFVFEDISEIKGNKFTYKVVEYNAGFIKLFDEVLTNASDHYIRTIQVKYIKIHVEKDHISIENDGPGIPIEIHKEHKMYVAELIFGNLMTGENFDENEQRMVGGTHGLGIKLTNIFSTKFIVETADGKKKYLQTFTNNMENKTKPKITKSTKNYTKITYYPDFQKFEMTEITDEIQSIFLKRAIDIAAYSPGVKVYYNDTLIPIKTFKDYMKMFIADDEELFYEKVNDNWEIGITRSPNDMFQQVSMVNGISTHIGGTHVNYISNQIVKLLGEKIEKSNKGVNIKQAMIKNHLFLFLNCRIPNPAFETQTKENLTTRMIGDLIKAVEVSDNFIKKLASSEIKNDIVNFATLKEFQEAKKSTQGGQKVKVRIAKLDDANKAGKSPDSMKCHLFLTEGDCLQEDTEITVIREGEKINIKIKDIKINDAVITHNNNIGIVDNIAKKIEKVVKINLSNNKILLCSENHKWYVYDKITNTFLFVKTKDIDKERHKMIINKNTFFNDFIKILEKEKINHKKYDYLLTLSTGEIYSSKNHKFSIFDSIEYKFDMISCEDLDKNRHFIVSYDKI